MTTNLLASWFTITLVTAFVLTLVDEWLHNRQYRGPDRRASRERVRP